MFITFVRGREGDVIVIVNTLPLGPGPHAQLVPGTENGIRYIHVTHGRQKLASEVAFVDLKNENFGEGCVTNNQLG